MKINVQAVNFNAKENLTEYLEKKLSKINQMYDNVISTNVFFKLENTSAKENKTIELILEVPGEDIVVKKSGQSFEECIDISTETAKKLLKKKKEKTTT
ncbi:MAG: ribosome-associated translation inhibitor RaiA [Flavobacteriales bacterium]|nr:ribosome-associated translation inhibitor RaiA [Flavobacteriales bacterium]